MGCQQGGPVSSPTAVARFGNTYLYQDEIQHFIPDSLKGQDSIRFVEKYCEAWIKRQAIVEAANKAIENLDEEIQYEMENYRQVLVERALASWLVSRNPNKMRVAETDITNYYKKFPEKFQSLQTYYQFFYLKTDLPNQYNVVSLLQSKQPEDLEKLIDWVKIHASTYKLDSTYLAERNIMPLAAGFYFGDIRRASRGNVYNYQHKEGDSTYYDFFKMIDIVRPGELMPLSLVREEIRAIILNKRRHTLIEQNIGRLVQQAKSDKDKVERFGIERR